MISEQQARQRSDGDRDFAQSLAHTLKNLLQVVNGNLELLSTKVEDDQLRGYIRNAQLAAEQITELAGKMDGRSSGSERA